MALILDGTTGIVANNIADYAISTAKLANSAVTSAKMGYSGAILQIVTAVTNQTDFSTSSTSFIPVTSVTASITPLFASSKIIINLTAPRVNAYSDIYGLMIQIYRTSPSTVEVGTPNGFPFYPFGTGGTQRSGTIQAVGIDTPNTTSAVTYQMYGRSNNGGTVFLADGHKQTFVIMEVAA